ncbi:tetratricopeptide repeat protein [candidate division WOR-3 bacterium]|nr:tetratricopeptide repeat protein [candidate division WOR-3 bacterium]
MPDELAIDSGALIFATLADVYLSSGMVDEAISILQDGLSRNPTYTLAKIILGRAYYMKGDIKEAIKILEGTYDDAKDSENTNLYLGHCYKKLGEIDKALKYYETVHKINPENKEAKQGIEELKTEPVKAAEVKVEEVPEPVRVEEVKVEEPTQPMEVAEEKVEEPTQPMEVAEAKVEEPTQPMQAAEVKVEEPTQPMEAAEVKVEEPTEFEVPLESLKKPVNRLLGIKTVKGAFICSKDGLLIENYYKGRTDIDEICAMIAAIHNEAEEAFKFLKEGYVEKFIIEKEEETICVIATGASLLTVITQSEVKPGLVFVYARKIIDEIREILG